MTFKRDTLQVFVDSGDKSPPPVFAGRGDIIDDMEKMARSAWKGPDARTHGVPGLTRII